MTGAMSLSFTASRWSRWLPWSGVNLVGRRQALLPRPGAVNTNSRPAGAAEIPPGRIQPGRFGKVAGLRHLDAVGERQALGASPGVAEPHLAAGFEVEHVLVQ